MTTIIGNRANNVLRGTEDGDYIDGAGGTDQLYGYGGNDTLVGGNNGACERDYMFGGAGDDTYYVDNEGDLVFEIANQGIDTVILTAASRLRSVESPIACFFSKRSRRALWKQRPSTF